MQRIAYIRLRSAPRDIGASAAFFSSLWAATDSQSFSAFVKHRWEVLDVSATGTLIAGTVAIYVAALILTRDWDKSDRDFYKGQLRRIFDDIAQHKQAVLTSPSDEHLRECDDAYQRLEHEAQTWLLEWMGQSAVTKYIRAGSSHGFSWDGDHDPQVKEIRDRLLDRLGDRLINVEAMMQNGTWDHPDSLAHRRWVGRWQKLKGMIHG